MSKKWYSLVFLIYSNQFNQNLLFMLKAFSSTYRFITRINLAWGLISTILIFTIYSISAETTQNSTSLPGGVSPAFNTRVLEVISKMPVGGEYAVSRTAAQALRNSITLDDKGQLSINEASATPSFCSGAVYLVLLRALKPEIDAIKDNTTRQKLIRSLTVAGQADGVGIWGRWNSNGPGMAVTFIEAEMGRSSWDFKSAIPGDFLKLWWTESIGSKEAGHSVVFLGFKKAENGEDGVEFWSSNKPGGYGKKVVAFSKIKHALVTRCEHPSKVTEFLRLEQKNVFLADMLNRETTPDEINKKILMSNLTPRKIR